MPSRAAVDPARARSVFINCPFDETYKPLLRAACFAIIACGHTPRCALDFDDGGAVRVVEIIKLIAGCGFSVHDISRVQLDTSNNLPRFNMPFELGADLGLRLQGPKAQQSRKTLILDGAPHQYDKTLSDISGMDPKFHGDDVNQVIRHVRDWLNANWDSSWGQHPPGANAICADHVAYLQIAPDIIQTLRLDPHDDLPHIDYLKVVHLALPRIAAARGANP